MKIHKEYIKQLLEDIDGGRGIIDPEVMANTPERVSRMYSKELFAGYDADPQDVLRKTFPCDHREMVIVDAISFASTCEHHMLPFRGTAHIGYIPNGRVLGLSKFVRLLNILARRLQLQERLVSQIADELMKGIQPAGVGVVIDAEHECMAIRGVNRPGTRTIISAMRGTFDTDILVEERFLRLIRINGGR